MSRMLRALPPLSRKTGAAGAALLLVAYAISARDAFLQAWLVAWLFLLAIALGGMANVMIHELTGGEWGLVLRPPLEAAMATLPLLALAALPLGLGIHDLFPWARSDAAAKGLQAPNVAWLNAPLFLLRSTLVLAVWSALAVAFLRQTYAGRAPGALRARRRLAIAGLLVYLFTVTVAAFDWIASLVPAWYSSAVGVRLGASQFLAALAFAVPCAVRRERTLPPRDAQDFGNLLLTYAMTWAYIAFTQYLIVWAEDLPRTIGWYWPRVETSWRIVVLPLVVLNFALPAAAMLFRRIKRDPLALASICAATLLGQWLDAFWLVVPSLRPEGFAVHVADLLVPIGLGAVWLAVFSALVARMPTPATVAGPEAPAHG